MSLIIEALKRARDDALRRQAASRGLPLAPIPRLKGRSRWLTLALVPLAAALVVCILLLIDLYSRIPEAAGQPPTAEVVADSSAGQPRAREAAATPSEEPAATTAPPDASVQPEVDDLDPTAAAPSSTTVATPPTREPQRSAPIETSPVGSTATPRAAAVPAPSPSISDTDSSVQASPTREFVGQARLADGQLVDIGGIAWSESEPFALLNGQVVGVGELVRAYRVIDITPDQVVLEKDEDRVVLRLE